jgi:prepilin-type N-terminal cleavage/methylation domain-containing protein
VLVDKDVDASRLSTHINLGLVIVKMSMYKQQFGFTLLELLLVVAILAIISGSIIAFFGGGGSGIKSNTLRVATDIQMRALREALLSYRADHLGKLPLAHDASVGANTFQPKMASPVDISFLIKNHLLGDGDPANNQDLAWSADYQRGWRGPYLQTTHIDYVDVGDVWQSDGNHGPHFVDDGVVVDQMALADTYQSAAVRPVSVSGSGDSLLNSSVAQRQYRPCTENLANTECVLDWRKIVGEQSSVFSNSGRPLVMLGFDDIAKARIVSFGPNGVFDSSDVVEDYLANNSLAAGDYSCRLIADATRFTAGNDDIVLCLL